MAAGHVQAFVLAAAKTQLGAALGQADVGQAALG
jgi:hypothetical protein